MSKSKILKRLQEMKWVAPYWRVKDFIVYESDKSITFSYYHGDMGLVDMIIYDKENNLASVYELNNYYGDTDLVVKVYI